MTDHSRLDRDLASVKALEEDERLADVAPFDPKELELPLEIGEGSVRSVYQPIVDLATSEVVAVEALARGPEGSPVASPFHLFNKAREVGLAGELDRLCRAAAIDGALAAGLTGPTALFVNVEPDTLGDNMPFASIARWNAAGRPFPIVLEVTERAIADKPAELFASVSLARRLGWAIAIDDLGVDARSLAMLPFLRPDVIKLDMSIVQTAEDSLAAQVMHAVAAEQERSGAEIVAEGIETEAHAVTANAIGATLGQGWFYGRPGEIEGPRAGRNLRRISKPLFDVRNTTPYKLASSLRDVRASKKKTLLAMSRYLETQALGSADPPVVISTFQSAEMFTPATARLYEQLATAAPLVGAIGVGMPAEPAPGVRGARLATDDPLRGEWVVLVISPHFAAGMIASDLGDTGEDMERRFDYVLTYDRSLVTDAALSLMQLMIEVPS